MSTRAIYTFKGFGETHHVFKDHNGHLSGAAIALNNALSIAWPLPRYEPDEFAGAFVWATKEGAGGVRLAKSQTAFCDVEYAYVIEPDKRIPDLLKVTAYSVDFGVTTKAKRTKIWSGPLKTFIATAWQIEDDYYGET